MQRVQGSGGGVMRGVGGVGVIVIRRVSLEDTVQVRFAEHDEVVERFATDRSDEPLNVAALPRRAWCARVISDLHCTNAAGVRPAPIAARVPPPVSRALVPGETATPPTRHPTGRRRLRSTEPPPVRPGAAY